MRNLVRTGALAAALICSTGLAGCRHLEYHFGPLGFADSRPDPAAQPVRKARSSVAKRVAEPKLVQAGSRIRNFCGQRHIRFHAGALKESDSEKGRNDVLCRQAY